MEKRPNLSIYLHKQLRARAKAGEHNFLNKVVEIASEAGIEARFKPDEFSQRLGSIRRNEYALFHMREPLGENSLCFRRVYFYPFWQIEKTNERWNWDTAKTEFSGLDVDQNEIDRFFDHWKNTHFPEIQASSEGFVYVPLQGVLTKKRSFQSMSPIEMIKQLAKSERHRTIFVTLHPNETYSSDEISELQSTIEKFPNLNLSDESANRLSSACEYIVTQNSGTAFKAFFLEKPTILCAGVDFHHITVDAGNVGMSEAVKRVIEHKPDYKSYVYWFLQNQAINAGKPDAKEKIRKRLRHLGWQV